MHAHPSRKMAQELMIFGFLTRNPHTERGIGKGFFHNAEEFYDVFGHKERRGRKEPWHPTEQSLQQQAAGVQNSWRHGKLC